MKFSSDMCTFIEGHILLEGAKGGEVLKTALKGYKRYSGENDGSVCDSWCMSCAVDAKKQKVDQMKVRRMKAKQAKLIQE